MDPFTRMLRKFQKFQAKIVLLSRVDGVVAIYEYLGIE
jgi:hypothetical protein